MDIMYCSVQITVNVVNAQIFICCRDVKMHEQ